MRIVGCGLIAVAALLGLAPAAVASELSDWPSGTSAEAAGTHPSTGSAVQAAERGADPHTEVSLLAVSLTAGAAVAAAGSGAVQAVQRRRAPSRVPGRSSGDAPQDSVHL